MNLRIKHVSAKNLRKRCVCNAGSSRPNGTLSKKIINRDVAQNIHITRSNGDAKRTRCAFKVLYGRCYRSHIIRLKLVSLGESIQNSYYCSHYSDPYMCLMNEFVIAHKLRGDISKDT